MKRLNLLVLTSTTLLFVGCIYVASYNVETFKEHQLHEISQLIKNEQENIMVRFDLIKRILDLASSAPVTMSITGAPPIQQIPSKDVLHFFEQIRSAMDLLAVFVLDSNGTCLLSTDPRFQGKNYGFRPYFKAAMQTGSGAYVAKGVTSNELGLYISRRPPGGSYVLVFKLNPCDILNDTHGGTGKNFQTFLATEPGVLLNRECRLFSLAPLHLDSQDPHRFNCMDVIPLGFKADTFARLIQKGQLSLRVKRRQYYLRYFPLLSNALGIVTIVSDRYTTPILNRLERGIVFMSGLFLLAMIPLCFLILLLKRQQEALRRQRKDLESYKKRVRLLDTAIEQTANSIVITDVNGVIEWVNPAFTIVTGYSAQEAIGQRPNILNAGVQDKAFYEEMWKTLMSKQVWHGRFCNKKKDGTIYWEDAIISPVLDEQGEIVHFIAIKSDITKLVLLEEELKNKVRELETIMDHAGAGILLVKNKRFVKVNKKFSELMEIPHEDLIGRDVRLIFDSEEQYGHFSNTLYPRLLSGETISFEHQRIAQGGKKQWFHIVASVAKPGTEEDMEIVWVVHDISEIKLLQARLEEEKEKAQAANQAKGDFLASVSHEIRTPLNGILGMLSLLETTNLNDKQMHFVKTAKNSAEILLFLINDILDLSKIEAGAIDLEVIDFDLKQVVEHSVSTLEALALKKGLEIGVSLDENIPACLRGDPYRLRQVLMNLIGNAIKFTERGSIKVSVKVLGRKSGEVILKFTVRDTGIGIPRELQGRLFKKFSQVDSSIGRRFGGTGLGLAICRSLVDIMGGEIGVVSEEGRGSEFWFTVPYLEGDPGPNGCGSIFESPQGLSQEFEGCQKRILVVDDNIINQQVVLSMLTKLGLTAHAVSSGIDALDALSSIPYDLVLMDLQMPEMDGFETSRRIRSGTVKVLDPNIPVIALSAHPALKTQGHGEATGIDDFLEKPIAPQRLIAVLRKWLKCHEQVNSSAPEGPSTRDTSKTRSTDIQHQPHFDQDELLERVMGDLALFKRVIKAYLDNTPGLLEALEGAVRGGRRSEIKNIAHNLKGSSANIGAKRLAALAEVLEDCADDLDLEALTEKVDEIRLEFSMLAQALERDVTTD